MQWFRRFCRLPVTSFCQVSPHLGQSSRGWLCRYTMCQVVPISSSFTFTWTAWLYIESPHRVQSWVQATFSCELSPMPTHQPLLLIWSCLGLSQLHLLRQNSGQISQRCHVFITAHLPDIQRGHMTFLSWWAGAPGEVRGESPPTSV